MELLRNFLDTIVNGAKSEGPSITDALTGLDEIANDPQSGLDPKLKHYLERRSYIKALDHIREMKEAEAS
jgi:hypothetical protein